jgi:phage-related protein
VTDQFTLDTCDVKRTGARMRRSPVAPGSPHFRRVHINVNLRMREIVLYTTWTGRCPVEEFLDSLSEKQRSKIGWVFRIVESTEIVPPQYFSKLADTDGLWEVRAEFGGDALRLIGFFDGGRLVILVSGFAKKTARTPLGEIDLAQERRREYFRRKGQAGDE